MTGRRLTFAVVGADGVPLTAHFTLTDDSHALVGQAQYRAPFALTFRRH
jgi:hypothetical protein